MYSSLEGSLKARQLIEDAAQSPDVTLLIIWFSFTQLWGDVAWGSNNLQSEERRHCFMLEFKLSENVG